MKGAFRIEGFTIASADGMIADHTGLMPNSLKFESDQRLYIEALDRADVVIHGRKSYEGQANSPRRRRLIMTRSITGLAPLEPNLTGQYWNPAGATLEAACAAVGCEGGTLAIIGGAEVFSYFLTVGYDSFVFCHADKVRLPAGVPVFADGWQGIAPETSLTVAGMFVAEAHPLEPDVRFELWLPAPR